MALGSWTGIYIRVIDDLMDQRREQELLLLLAIQKHSDPFGFSFPGRARLMRKRHCSKARYEAREAFLIDQGYIAVTEVFNPRRRQYEPDFQISPRVLYVRPEIQTYCEMVFDGIEERNFALEKKFLVNLFSTKESQPEALPESETREKTRRSKPASGNSPIKQHNNQLRPPTQTDAHVSTMRNGAKPEKSDSDQQRRPAQNRNDNPQAGGPDEFEALLSPDVDDDRLAKEIVHVVSTTDHQAAAAVATYPRDLIVFCLRKTAQRRAKGELQKPGGWFFKMLQKHNPVIVLQEGNPDSVINAYTGQKI